VDVLRHSIPTPGKAAPAIGSGSAPAGNPPDVIIAIANNLALDFKAATTTIPIVGVFAVPVEVGIVASLERPGGNITGVTVDVGTEQWAKRIQLLQQVVPQATRLGFLQTRAVQERWGAFQRELARRTGIVWVGPPLDHPANEAEYRRVFATLAQDGAEGIVVNDEEENSANRKLIPELSEKTRLPAIYPFKMYVEAGGLMSYGINLPGIARRVATWSAKSLRARNQARCQSSSRPNSNW
jgi:putative ABC transport system substrate-binding protein